jgi:hypothetical protein
MSFYPGAVHRPALRSGTPGLAGTGRIADDLYLIAHHEASGRPRLSSRATGIAMAAGLLAELMAAEAPALTVHRGRLFPLPHLSRDQMARPLRPADLVAGHVLGLVIVEPEPLPVRDWLLFLGQAAAAAVAGRLERAGYLARPPARLPWRAAGLVPADWNSSHCALLRAHAALEAGRDLTPYEALLAGLTVACGLEFRFSGFPATRTAAEATRTLPRPMRELIAQVQATADSTVLSTRS